MGERTMHRPQKLIGIQRIDEKSEGAGRHKSKVPYPREGYSLNLMGRSPPRLSANQTAANLLLIIEN
jgi:hypothetical protein